MRYTFHAGWRVVTVHADDYDAATLKAREALDRRVARQGGDAPVAWTLELAETNDQVEIDARGWQRRLGCDGV
jgi:hypothetical protein